MTREERLQYCKVCKNQRFDRQQGIICNLTSAPASFDITCESFKEDIDLKQKLEAKTIDLEKQLDLASQGKRFINYLLDLVFVMGFGFISGIAIAITLSLFSPSYLYLFDGDNKAIEYLLGIIITLFYYVFLEATTGRTIAKFITSTKVVDENGNNPKFGAILVRSLYRLIPFEPISFLISDNSTGWHDTASKTRVVNA